MFWEACGSESGYRNTDRSGGTSAPVLRVASRHFACRIKMSAKHEGVRCTVLQLPNNL